ncbi:DnaT-like ssDNA-binding protein [Limoniibacter endophyticus]|uniref:Putative DnaT-like domain-containing protein n=1 Tax=Limoniibacter endophyticus TaxID=1565040 RepID=A0A8J3DUU9_9HYPH|nr:DnaT-like ssDNA-binding protein [Limoniibacter endophyticus]GHC79414.1 hypothetical protein GCM10010136_31930 [Limoniibacter endophyticus]
MTPYGSLDGFSAYAEAMGYDVPVGAVAPALMRGSVYVDGTYGSKFVGQPADPTQDRAWPRTGVPGIAVDQVPPRIEYAAYEAALAELRTPGSLSIIVTGAGRVVREKVGEIEVQYANPGGDAVADAKPVLTVIEGLVAPFLKTDTHVPAIMVV